MKQRASCVKLITAYAEVARLQDATELKTVFYGTTRTKGVLGIGSQDGRTLTVAELQHNLALCAKYCLNNNTPISYERVTYEIGQRVLAEDDPTAPWRTGVIMGKATPGAYGIAFGATAAQVSSVAHAVLSERMEMPGWEAGAAAPSDIGEATRAS